MKILFEHHHLYYLPQFLPIIYKFNKNGSHNISVSINQNVPANEKTLFYKECNSLKLNIIRSENEKERKQFIKHENFDIIIAGNKGYLEAIAANNTCVVLVYHGIGLKKSYYNDISPRVDILAVEAPSRLPSLKGLSIHPIVSGFTKLDALLSNRKINDEEMGAIHFENNYPTFLYAPTFYPSSLEKTIPFLAGIKLKVNVLVKLHQFSWTKLKYRHHIRLIKSTEQRNKNIKLVQESTYNIVPLYPIVDGLISDISSTMFEFLAVNKPIIQTDFYTLRKKHQLFPWLINKRLDFKRLGEVDFTIKANSPKEIERALKQSLENPGEHDKNRLEAQNKFLYKVDGKASERLIEGILEYMKL